MVLGPPREGILNWGGGGVPRAGSEFQGIQEKRQRRGWGGTHVCIRYCKKGCKSPRLGLEVQVGYSARAIPADQCLWPSPQGPALSLQPFCGWIIGLGFQTL